MTATSKAAELKARVARMFGAPLEGIGKAEVPARDRRAQRAAWTLLNDSKRLAMPAQRVRELELVVAEALGRSGEPKLSTEDLRSLLDDRENSEECGFSPHGRLVVNQLMADADSARDALHEFFCLWRQHFFDHMKPLHLKQEWIRAVT